jgi:MFS family permease
MGTLSREDATVCQFNAVLITMALGVGIGIAAAVTIVLSDHLISAVAHPEVASPTLSGGLILGTFGAVMSAVAAVVGAAVALAIFDRALRRTRLVQAGTASIGAVGAGLALLAYLGPAVTGGPLLGLVALTTFALMFFRARTHTRPH